MNLFLVLIFALLTGDYLIETISDVLNMRNLGAELPNELADVFDRSAYARSLEYQRARLKPTPLTLSHRVAHPSDFRPIAAPVKRKLGILLVIHPVALLIP